MNYQELVALIDHLDQSSIAFLDYQAEGTRLVLSKEVPHVTSTPDASPMTQTPVTQEAVSVEESPALATVEGPVPSEPAAAEEVAGEVVESPMVGVVYLQPNPDEDQYVKVGDRVEQGQVICIIEAMKLMNEIQAPQAGVVTEILVENEAVVEFKQPLIRIDATI